MKSLLILAIALAGAQAFVAKVKTPDVDMCLDGTENWFKGISLNVVPWPVHIAQGATISLDGQIELLKTINAGSKLKLDLKLKSAIGNLPIPCIPIGDLSIGSCEYDAQRLIDVLAATGHCDQIMANGQPCSLPLNPGIYAEGGDPIVIEIPEIPSALEPFLKGEIDAKAIGKSPEGNEDFCLHIKIKLE